MIRGDGVGSKYETVEILLRQYRENLACFGICYNELIKHQQQLRLHEIGKIESKDEIIEGLCNHAPVLSKIPKSITNKFSSATEDAVFNYRYYLQPSELEINAIKQIIKEKSKLVDIYSTQINLVDYLFEGLSDLEKFILETIYIKGYNQRQAMQMLNTELPHCFISEKKTFVVKKLEALEKIKKVLEKTK